MISANQVAEMVKRALSEDVGAGDLTASLIPAGSLSKAIVICREPAVLSGSAWFEEVFNQLDPAIEIDWKVRDGELMEAGETVCSLTGASSPVLTGERTALNFLQTLSATATLTNAYVQAVAGTGATILDTRKTIPGLRLAQKYAVTCGGGSNHRMGLYDAVLVKENHILAAGSVTWAVELAASAKHGVEIQVEVEDIAQLNEALRAGVRRILLDNFSLAQLQEAVEINAGQARLEASGGVNLDTIRTIAETGVDDISVGALTKDVKAVDFSMRFAEPVQD